jgi:MFS family permease
MGIGVGLSASPSAAALVEFSPAAQSKRAGSITTAAQSLGLALATLVGGALIEYAPFPTRLNFWVLFAVIAVIFTATWFLPRHTSTEASGPWRPKIPRVPQSLYKIFATSTVAITIGYALGAIMMSLGAQIAHDLIGSNNRLVNGAAMSLLAITSGIAAVSGKRLAPSFSMLFGGLASFVGMGLLALSTNQRSLPIFLAAVAIAGVGYSLSFLVSTSSMPTPPSIIAAGPFQRYWSLPTSFKEPSRFSWASPPRRGDLESRLILVQLPSPCLAQ